MIYPNLKECPTCEGSGEATGGQSLEGMREFSQECPTCEGNGRVHAYVDIYIWREAGCNFKEDGPTITLDAFHYEYLELGNMDSLDDLLEGVTEWEFYNEDEIQVERAYRLKLQRYGGPGDWEVFDYDIDDEPIEIIDDLPFK